MSLDQYLRYLNARPVLSAPGLSVRILLELDPPAGFVSVLTVLALAPLEVA